MCLSFNGAQSTLLNSGLAWSFDRQLQLRPDLEFSKNTPTAPKPIRTGVPWFWSSCNWLSVQFQLLVGPVSTACWTSFNCLLDQFQPGVRPLSAGVDHSRLVMSHLPRLIFISFWLFITLQFLLIMLHIQPHFRTSFQMLYPPN